MRRFTINIAAAIILASGSARAADLTPTQATRGLAAQIELDYQPRLRARAEQTTHSPIMVRVHSLQGLTGNRQAIEFIGNVAGSFDLRDYLEREDGLPLSDLAAIPINVVSQLPADHGVDLYGSDGSWLSWRTRYREMMWTAVALWLAVPAVVIVAQRLRRKRVVEIVASSPPTPTVAERLRAALEIAQRRPLSVDESGQLELLVFRYFGARLGDERDHSDEVGGGLAEMLHKVRENPETRELVMAIERWLHTRGGSESGHEFSALALEELRCIPLAPRNATQAEVTP